MSSSLIAMGISLAIVISIVAGLAFLSLLSGVASFFLGKPTFKILKSKQGKSGFAFYFDWNQASGPVKFDQVKVRAFNPFGSPTQVDVLKDLEPQKESFAVDLDMGPDFASLITARGLDKGTVQVEFSASKEGVVHQYDFKGQKFLRLFKEASDFVEAYQDEEDNKTSIKFWTEVQTGSVADTVPGKGAALKIASNPLFSDAFGSAPPGMPQGAKGGSGGEGGEAAANYEVAKVWIIEGCIVCDACANVYPEVFEVLPDTCIIRPEAAPGSELLKNGLLIEEAAEACPVEVIKFDKIAG